jgi:hypothetical protein
MLLDIALIYRAALWEAFVTDGFRSVPVARPEMLRSSRQVTYETALAFPDRAAMIDFIAQREIGEMSYKSFRDQVS